VCCSLAVGGGLPILPRSEHPVSLQVFNVHTLLVKFASCALAVGSGLPVGPEGPMVHIGAMVGAALSQGHSTTLGFDTGLFRRFQNPKDKRDFVTAGNCLIVF
jgi:chloride channel 7